MKQYDIDDVMATVKGVMDGQDMQDEVLERIEKAVDGLRLKVDLLGSNLAAVTAHVSSVEQTYSGLLIWVKRLANEPKNARKKRRKKSIR